MKKIAIIGSGISSMYAVLACSEKGIVPDWYTKDEVVQPGAVFLHRLPKSLYSKFKLEEIHITSSGNRRVYIQKQWVDHPKEYKSSFPLGACVSLGFNPKPVLSYFLSLKSIANKYPLENPMNDDELYALTYQYDKVFHSFPTKFITNKYSRFVEKIPVLSSLHTYKAFQNGIHYDGTPESIITRDSILFGSRFIELSSRIDYSDEEIRSFFPKYSLKYIQDISPEIVRDEKDFPVRGKLIPIGRLARMARSELANVAFSLVGDILDEIN